MRFFQINLKRAFHPILLNRSSHLRKIEIPLPSRKETRIRYGNSFEKLLMTIKSSNRKINTNLESWRILFKMVRWYWWYLGYGGGSDAGVHWYCCWGVVGGGYSKTSETSIGDSDDIPFSPKMLICGVCSGKPKLHNGKRFGKLQ